MGIAAKTIRTMERVYGAEAKNIRAAIGPGISKCCFETGDDVPAAMHSALGTAADAYMTQESNGKWHVDLKALNAHWMGQAGVAAEHISVSAACTACDIALYWSHRIVGDARGSQAAMICMN